MTDGVFFQLNEKKLTLELAVERLTEELSQVTAEKDDLLERFQENGQRICSMIKELERLKSEHADHSQDFMGKLSTSQKEIDDLRAQW